MLGYRSFSMDLTDSVSEPLNVLTSADDESPSGRDLLTVGYTRVQKNSPEFSIVYGGIDQSVELMLSTVIVRVTPEAVLTLYDFVMTTFVPSNGNPVPVQATPVEAPDASAQQATSDQRIRVSMGLDGVKGWVPIGRFINRLLIMHTVILVNVSANLATLALSTATASISLVPNAMDISVQLGKISLTDDSAQKTASSDFKLLLSHEGSGNLAEIRYRTFDPTDKPSYPGVKSAFDLKAASLKLHYLEQPLHDLYVFLMKLAKLKGLYDAATQVAVQRAAEIERMQFDVAISSPVVVFPADPVVSRDVLTMRLGAISAKNSYAEDAKIEASLRGVQLTSTLVLEKGPATLKLIEDIEVTTEIVQPLERHEDDLRPDTQVSMILFSVTPTLMVI
jgi:vacuolar protein sorting-associated protein 13A/C